MGKMVLLLISLLLFRRLADVFFMCKWLQSYKKSGEYAPRKQKFVLTRSL